MKKEKLNLTTAQWHALAAMRMLRKPVSIDLLAVLTQLLPSQANHLLRLGLELKYLVEIDDDCFTLSDRIPELILRQIDSGINSELAETFLERLMNSELPESVNAELQADLYYHSENIDKAAMIENEQGYQALEKAHLGIALRHFERIIEWIPGPGENRIQEALFRSAVLELSHLRFCSGEKIGEIPKLLNLALKTAEERGDSRSRVLLQLHLTRHICNENRLEDVMGPYRKVLDDAKSLGDDFLVQSVEFSGLYYFFQGYYKEALTFFEEANQRVELKQQKPVAFFHRHWLGLCAAYVGQFHRAIGVFDSAWRRANQRSEWALADNYRSDLGIVLLTAGKTEEAFFHLTEMLENALERGNLNAVYMGRMGLSYYHYLENRPKEAYKLMLEAIQTAREQNILFRQYSWPWFLEMLYGFNRLNYPGINEFDYKQELDLKVNGPNILLRGVALRLKGKEAVFSHDDPETVEGLFAESEHYLKLTGNPIELGKTWVEMARYHMVKKEYTSARNYSMMAWEVLTGFNKTLFPADLKPVLEGNIDEPIVLQTPRNSLDVITDSLDKLILSHNIESFLRRILSTLGDFFGVGRGCLFWQEDVKKKNIRYKVGYNLSEEEVSRDDFRTSVTSILKSARKNRVIIKKKSSGNPGKRWMETRTLLCIPLEIGEDVQGVLYFDNAYNEKAFDILSKEQLNILSHYLGRLVGNITSYFKSIVSSSYDKGMNTSTILYSASSELKAECPSMKKILSLADKAADSDASILILGETGVGKELLAKRIHQMNSKRCHGPFHVVDISNISESLIESELFGYEKGAFTGADQKKIGRLEMSHGGTLFIDEIGNISLEIQSKLLRTLQEKCFVRVGGTEMIHTDFRLLAATNQDLEKDIKLGRFRADLFYRINVVPIKLPPLRERGEDILLLSNHFLELFMKKHGKLDLELDNETRKQLINYPWPGNIRELKNVIERAVLLSSDRKIKVDLSSGSDEDISISPFHDFPTMDELQKRYIAYVLERTNGKISGTGAAADILGMKRTTLTSRMKKLGF